MRALDRQEAAAALNARLAELVSRSHAHSFSYDFHLKVHPVQEISSCKVEK